jgi:hypothetical protein
MHLMADPVMDDADEAMAMLAGYRAQSGASTLNRDRWVTKTRNHETLRSFSLVLRNVIATRCRLSGR